MKHKHLTTLALAFAAALFGVQWGYAMTDAVQSYSVEKIKTTGKNVLSAAPVTIANGSTADLVVNFDYDTTEEIAGLNFSLYLPEGIVLDGFNSTEEMLSAKSSALRKACYVGEDGIWGEDVERNWLTVKTKTDGGLLFIFIDQGDKTPFVTTHCELVTIKLKALADVLGTGLISEIAMTNSNSLSVDLGNLADATFEISYSNEFVPPTVLTVTSNYVLDWLNKVDDSYKPVVNVTSDGSSYGQLTVVGDNTLSMEQFNISYYPGYGRSAYASLVNNATMRADNVTVNMDLLANRWEFISFPFDVNVSDIRLSLADLPFAIRTYDGQKRADGLTNETWVDVPADGMLNAGQGYIIRMPAIFGNYATFGFDALQTVNKNNIFANGNVEVPLANYESEFGHNRSWNLIGNPYPCFFDIRAMQTSAPVTVWNPSTQNYEAYSPADDAYILTPGQAFFVQKPVDEESIIFLNSGRQNNLTVRNVVYAQAARSTMEGTRSVFNLMLTADGQADRARFVINADASMDYETARDASKFQSLEPTAVQLYTIENGVRYSINERPFGEGIIALGVKIAEDGLYNISLDTKADQEVTLIDNLTGQVVRLDGNAEGYSFVSEAGTFESRFTISLGGGEATGIEEIAILQTQGTAIYDLQGRRVNNVQKGVYVVNGKKTVVK